jgi:hypothetical protein
MRKTLCPLRFIFFTAKFAKKKIRKEPQRLLVVRFPDHIAIDIYSILLTHKTES